MTVLQAWSYSPCAYSRTALQDFLTSAFLLTAKDRFYSRSDFAQLCSHMSDANQHVDLPVPTILKPMELWTGKQVFSVLVRPNTNTRYGPCCCHIYLISLCFSKFGAFGSWGMLSLSICLSARFAFV